MEHAQESRWTRAAYAVTAAVTAASGALEQRRTHAVSKPLLVPLLQARQMPAALRVALGGAWLGDVVLLPPGGAEDDDAARRRLRRGASAFAVQQLGYLALMYRAGIRPRARVALPVAGWLGALALLDARGQGGTPDPVVTGYGVLLGTMAVTAIGSGDRDLARGGAAFLASDSVILLREQLLRRPATRAAAEAFVLLSYAVAQRHLVDGLARSSSVTA